MTDIKIVSTYDLKVPINPNMEFSPWHHNTISVEVLVPDANTDEVEKQLKHWDSVVKAQVFSALAVPFYTDERGVFQPTIDVPVVAKAEPQKNSEGKYPARSANKQMQNATNTAPKATQGDVVWVDYRNAKSAGEVKPAFPDFKSLDGKDSLWLTKKDGSANERATQVANLFGEATSDPF